MTPSVSLSYGNTTSLAHAIARISNSGSSQKNPIEIKTKENIQTRSCVFIVQTLMIESGTIQRDSGNWSAYELP